MIGGVLTAMDGLGTDAQELYQQNLTELKARPDVVMALVQSLRKTRGMPTRARWKLVYLLGEVGDARAVQVLTEIAAQKPAPRRPRTGTKGGRTNDALATQEGQEAMIRRRAVWALEALVDSVPAAVNALRGLLRAPHREVRFEAGFALYRKEQLSTADKAVMASTGATGTIRVRSSHALTIRTQPSGASRARFEKKHQAALKAAANGPFLAAPQGVQP